MPASVSFDDNVFEVTDISGTHTMALEYLAITGSNDDAGLALETNTGFSFGQITVDHVTSNIPFNFSLVGSGSQSYGTVNFTNNIVDITNAAHVFTIGDFGAVRFVIDPLTTQNLTVEKFAYNQINITYRRYDADISGLYILASDTNPLSFSNGITGNKINVSHNSPINPSANLLVHGVDIIDSINIFGGIHDNTFKTTFNDASIVYGWEAYISNISITGDMYNNNVETSHNSGRGFGFRNFLGSMTILGNMYGNSFVASNNVNGAWSFYSSSVISITGDMYNNRFEASHRSYGYGLEIAAPLTILGNMHNNAFIASYNRENADGFIQNEFLSNSGTLMVGKDMYNNNFKAFYNSGRELGWISTNPMIAIVGDMYNNNFMVSNSASTSTLVAGWQAEQLTISGDMRNNTFNISNNPSDDVVAWRIDTANATISGFLKDNNVTMNNNKNVIGFDFKANTGNTVEFQNSVINNRFTFNNNFSGNEGFNLDTNDGAGTINFKDNSSKHELSSSNYNASIDDNGGLNINYYSN